MDSRFALNWLGLAHELILLWGLFQVVLTTTKESHKQRSLFNQSGFQLLTLCPFCCSSVLLSQVTLSYCSSVNLCFSSGSIKAVSELVVVVVVKAA